MVDENQRWYLLSRAQASLELAAKAIDPDIASIHLELYERYLQKAGQQPARHTPPRLVS